MQSFSGQYLGLWVAEDESKSVFIERDCEGTLRVSVYQQLGPHTHASERPAEWHPHQPSAAASTNARERLDRLTVELGEPTLGTTYELMFASRNENGNAFGGLMWRPVDPAVDVAEVRIFPEHGASYYEAVLGYWDDFVMDINEGDSWVEPLSTYRRATAEQVARHEASLAEADDHRPAAPRE